MEEPPPQDDDPNSSTLNPNKQEKLGVGKSQIPRFLCLSKVNMSP